MRYNYTPKLSHLSLIHIPAEMLKSLFLQIQVKSQVFELESKSSLRYLVTGPSQVSSHLMHAIQSA